MTELRIRPAQVELLTDDGEEIDLPRDPHDSCEEAARKVEKVVRVDSVSCEDRQSSRTRNRLDSGSVDAVDVGKNPRQPGSRAISEGSNNWLNTQRTGRVWRNPDAPSACPALSRQA